MDCQRDESPDRRDWKMLRVNCFTPRPIALEPLKVFKKELEIVKLVRVFAFFTGTPFGIPNQAYVKENLTCFLELSTLIFRKFKRGFAENSFQ